jgi:hypothetical protein
MHALKKKTATWQAHEVPKGKNEGLDRETLTQIRHELMDWTHGAEKIATQL